MCASCLHQKENNMILLCGNTPDLLCHVSQMYASTHRDKRTLGDFENKPSISLQEVFGRCQKNQFVASFSAGCATTFLRSYSLGWFISPTAGTNGSGTC